MVAPVPIAQQVSQILQRLEELVVSLCQVAWQQRQALIALRVGAVEALVAQQQRLLQELQAWQQQCGAFLEDIRRHPSLRQWWERIQLQAREARRLFQLNRLLAQRAQEHAAALLEALAPEGYLYDQRA